MSSSDSTPRLRLVGAGSSAAERERAQRRVRAENRAAAHVRLDATDPRWLLAVRTHASLVGSALPPERRARLRRTAERLGVRPFDASVIMAVVQDRARRGEDLGSVVPTLPMLHDPRSRRGRGHRGRWIVALALAAVATALLIRWVLAP